MQVERLCCVAFGVFLVGVCYAEFQVNTWISNDQRNADVAMEPGGGFAVIWTSYGQDGSSNGIFGQLFEPDLSPLGTEFQVNTVSSGNQTEPAVAMDAAAGFVAVWHGPGLTEEDQGDIFAQRLESGGVPLGGEFRVNRGTLGRQLYPDVAMGQDGGFVIVWESENIPQVGKKAICGQLYDSDGLEVGGEFVVNEVPAVCRYPAVAADADGNFAVAWLDDRSGRSILARLFTVDGSAKTGTFAANTIEFSSITRPSMAMNAEGAFVVAWDGDPDRASQDDIHARLFDPDGKPLDEQFFVNTTFDGPQCYPQVAMNDSGEFVIVWETRLDPDVTEREIFGQRFNNLGEPIGDEFLINTYTENDQRYPSVAIDEAGRFVTAWQSKGQDGSRYGIFAEAGRITGSADFNGDGLVDFLDYALFSGHWLEEGSALPMDLVFDKKIDHEDLAQFCHQWFTSGW
ncbi:MAG: hypothetical protein P8Z79_16620 [Sedimentisphaerales bacterium]